MNILARRLTNRLVSGVRFTKSHLARGVLMVRPVDFTYNPETAKDNEFMKKGTDDTLKRALSEYDKSAQLLRQLGVHVVEFDKSQYPEYSQFKAPDAVFPNNWFGTHDQDVWLYRMKNPSRSVEKLALAEILPLLSKHGYSYHCVRSWHDSVIEGTGVLLFDRRHRKIYINKSQRADNLLEEFCRVLGYEAVVFQATSKTGSPFYHTNVMLSIGDDYAVVSSYSIDEKNRGKVMDSLAKKKDRTIIEVNADQTEKSFCANILQLQGRDGPVIAMSQRAHDGFTQKQREQLSKHSKFAIFPLDVIETVGGGSARCMLAQLFLNRAPPPHKH